MNGLVLLAVPIVAGASFVALLKRLWQRRPVLFLALAVGACVVSIQLLLWHTQIGKWFAYGYEGEGFHWDRPEVLKVLFGFRRGLFLWTPVLLLSLADTLSFLGTYRRRAVWTLLYWTANVYIISAWWMRYYGSGFGARVFIDHYPVLALPMAMLLNTLGPRLWLFARFCISACCALLLFQMWQYNTFILHHESMDRAKYMHLPSLGRSLPRTTRRQLSGTTVQPQRHGGGARGRVRSGKCLRALEGDGIRRTSLAFSGSRACIIGPVMEYALGFSAEPGSLPIGRSLFLEVGYQRLEPSTGSSHALLAVTDVKHADGSQGFYEPFFINPLPAQVGRWEQVEYRIPVPPLEPGDRLAFYFWNRDHKAHVLIDNVFMRVSAVKPY